MSKAKAKTETLTEMLREAIESSGLSLYQLADETGVDRGLLSRFKNGKQSMTLETFDRLNEVLKLRITRR